MKTIALENACKPLADYAANIAEPIVVTANRKPVAALVPIEDVDRESLSLSLDPAFLKIIRRARAEVRRGDVYSLEQVKRELLVDQNKPGKSSRRKQTRRR